MISRRRYANNVDTLLEFLLTHGSYALLFLALMAAGAGVPLPEDIVLIAAGVLLHRQVILWVPAGAVLALGVLAGDSAIFFAGRRLGPQVFELRWLRRLATPARQAALERRFARHGGLMVVAARHVAGIRAPLFALAGAGGMSWWTFITWDALGLCVSGPLYVGIGYLFSDRLDDALRNVARLDHWIVFAGVAVVVAASLGAYLKRARR